MEQENKKGMVFTPVSKDNDLCIIPCQYQVGLAPNTNGPSSLQYPKHSCDLVQMSVSFDTEVNTSEKAASGTGLMRCTALASKSARSPVYRLLIAVLLTCSHPTVL